MNKKNCLDREQLQIGKDISVNKNLHQVLNRDKYQTNIAYISSLKYLKNKEEMLINYNPNFSIAVAVRKMIEVLEKRGIDYALDSYGYCLRVFPIGATPHIMHGINLGLNSTGVVKIFQDKILTNEILKQDGFLLPSEYVLQPKGGQFESNTNNYEGLLLFIEQVGFPVIVKPNKGERGEGIFVLASYDQVEDFYLKYNEGLYGEDLAIVQEFVKGNEYRVIYLDGEILLTYRKQPLTLIGDGVSSLKDLLMSKKLTASAIQEIEEYLVTKGYKLSYVLKANDQLQPYPFINNFSEKDVPVEYTEEDQEFLKKIAHSFGAKYFGLDVISEGPIHQGKIIELNAKPDVLWARKVSPEFNSVFWDKVLDSVAGKVPVEKEKKPSRSFDLGITPEEYVDKVNSLQYLTNKQEVLASPNMIKHGIFLLLEEIEKDKFQYTIDEYGFLITIHLPNGKNRLIYNADYGFDSSSLRRIFEDKIYTSKLLRQGGFSTPNDMLVLKEKSSYSTNANNIQACLNFAEENGYPLVFKPNDGSLGVGVKKIFNEEQLLQELYEYNNSKRGLYLLQKYIPGKDYRVIYLDGEILSAYERIPPRIIGDGRRTIKQLIDSQYQDLETQKIIDYLNQQNLDLSDILPEGEELNLLPTANIATGGLVREVERTEEDRQFLEQVANHFGSRYFGVDILTNGSLADGIILEINKSPITKGISSASSLFRSTYPQKIWSAIKRDEGILDAGTRESEK